MKNILPLALISASAFTVTAQYPTNGIPSNNYIVYRNFNTSHEGFITHSIYSE